MQETKNINTQTEIGQQLQNNKYTNDLLDKEIAKLNISSKNHTEFDGLQKELENAYTEFQNEIDLTTKSFKQDFHKLYKEIQK